MGSKSSDVAAPDPRLVEAQIRSMGVQETAIRQIMDSSAELMPLQKEQMQFGLDSARTSYDQSQADRKYAIERRDKLTGLQDNIIDEAKQFNTGDRAKELAGKAIAGVNQSFDSAGDIAKRNLTRAGVNPADGKFADMSKQLTIARALGGASAGTAAQGQARAEGLALNDRAANVLAGYPAMGMNTTGQGAQFGANGMNIVNAGANGMNAGYSNASQMAASWGNNATGMFGQQANYKTAQDQAQGNPLSDITQLVGTGLGAYAKFDPHAPTNRALSALARTLRAWASIRSSTGPRSARSGAPGASSASWPMRWLRSCRPRSASTLTGTRSLTTA